MESQDIINRENNCISTFRRARAGLNVEPLNLGTYCAGPFLFRFDEDDDNLRSYSHIADLGGVVISRRYPKVQILRLSDIRLFYGFDFFQFYKYPMSRDPHFFVSLEKD